MRVVGIRTAPKVERATSCAKTILTDVCGDRDRRMVVKVVAREELQLSLAESDGERCSRQGVRIGGGALLGGSALWLWPPSLWAALAATKLQEIEIPTRHNRAASKQPSPMWLREQ